MKIIVSIETAPLAWSPDPTGRPMAQADTDAHEQEAREEAGAMLETISTQLRDGYREGHLANQAGTWAYWKVEW